jgi:hypothetical protein
VNELDKLIAQVEAQIQRLAGQLDLLRELKRMGWTVEPPKPVEQAREPDPQG